MKLSLIFLSLFFTASVVAPLPASAVDEGAVARGGKLYDKWFKVIKADKPKDTHPAWPAANTKKKGNTTWRCKSCHGWDLKGAKGAYASGSYDTGIKGVAGMAGADPAKIIAILKDDTHKLADKLSDGDFMDLALFVSTGIDMDRFIDPASKAVKGGEAAKGRNYYNTLCVSCHGKEGELPKDMKTTLGEQMGNPWEVMHKILNGQPGEQMPALRALDRQVVVDIMAHLATLPKER